MLDMADGVTDHTRNQDLALRQLDILPDGPLPLVARIGGLDREPLRIDPQDQIGDGAKQYIARVRTRPRPPTHVVTDLL